MVLKKNLTPNPFPSPMLSVKFYPLTDKLPKPILPLVPPFPHLRVFTSCWGPHLRLFFRVDFFFFFFPLEEGGGVKSLSWEALWGAQKSGIRGPGGSPIPPTRAVAAGEAGPRSLEDEGPVSNT